MRYNEFNRIMHKIKPIINQNKNQWITIDRRFIFKFLEETDMIYKLLQNKLWN